MAYKGNDIEKRWNALKGERSSWIGQWKDVSENLIPRMGRYFVEDRNRGENRYTQRYDSSGTRALRILSAGMMSGMTSPARPWFRLATPDPDLSKQQPVREWLDKIAKIMFRIFAKSNTYRALATHYEELGAFGTSAGVIVPDFSTVLTHHMMTAGEYAVAVNDLGDVDTLYREFQRTVKDIVGMFGRANCSNEVQSQYDNGDYHIWHTLIHGIEPREALAAGKEDSFNMPFRSIYIEQGRCEKVLRESGFKSFPALVPRWSISGGDMYGTSPAMDALGDLKQLQHQHRRKGQAIDYGVRPPLQAPEILRGREVSMLPGGLTYFNTTGSGNQVKNLFDVQLDLEHLLADIQDTRGRVDSAFYADLFLMLAMADKQMTATEVAERHEEKLLMLGPVLERLHNELLWKLIDSTFTRMVEAGIVPRPPQEIRGHELEVEFVSVLAQAQKAIGTQAIDRFTNSLGVIAQVKPDVLDKFNADEWAENYSDMLGVSPSLIVPSKEVVLIRQGRAQAQAEAAKAQTENLAADTALKGAKAQQAAPAPQGMPPMQNVMDMFTGYGSPATTEGAPGV